MTSLTILTPLSPKLVLITGTIAKRFLSKQFWRNSKAIGDIPPEIWSAHPKVWLPTPVSKTPPFRVNPMQMTPSKSESQGITYTSADTFWEQAKHEIRQTTLPSQATTKTLKEASRLSWGKKDTKDIKTVADWEKSKQNETHWST